MSDEVSAFESIPPARTLPTDLPPEQITFLKIVSLPMITGGKAAPWEWVLDHCEDEDLDAEQILKKLPRIGVSGKSYGFTTPKTTSLEGREEIRPTVAASLILPDLRAALGESFIRVLRYMVELYQNRPRSVTVANSVAAVLRSNELPQIFMAMRPEFIAGLPQIFAYEPYIRNAGKREFEDGGWEWPIDRSIRDFKDVATLAQYVERTCELTPKDIYPGGNFAVMQRLAARSGLDLLTPTLPVQSPPADDVRVYAKKQLIAELEELDGADGLRTGKLVELLTELNFNFAHSKPLACSSLLRAVIDHVPPGFGFPLGAGFARVVAEGGWGRTDKKYLQKLADFRDQGDDVMHRQMDWRRSWIDMDDMPAAVTLNALLDGLVGKLKAARSASSSS